VIPDHIVADFRRYLRATPVGQQSTKSYAAWCRDKGGARDAAPRPERRMVVKGKRPAPSRPAPSKNRRRDPAPSVFAYDGPPRAIPLPQKTAVGSIDYSLLVLGRGMARDAGEMRRGGRGMTRDQGAFSELENLLRERLGPEEAQKAQSLVARMLKEKDAQRQKHEQEELCDFLRRHHDFDDADLEKVRSLVVTDAEMPSVERGQQGHEIGPEAWWTTRGRDRRGRDADPPPQHEVETTDAWHSPPHGEFDMPGEEEEEPMEPRDVPRGLALDPPVSEAQRRAMYAAREGRSTLGIPKEVGEHFVGRARDDEDDYDAEEEDDKLRAMLSRHIDEGHPGFGRALDLARRALDRHRQKRRAIGDAEEWRGSARPTPRRAPFEEPPDSETDRELKKVLSRFSNLSEAGIKRALELTREARRRQPAATSGSLDEPPPFKGMPEPGGGMAGDRALPSFQDMFPEASRLAPSSLTLTRTFLR
jgi:hypothetical protein